MRNDDKVREMLNEEKIPAELEPENIRKMLEEKAPAKKRSRIKLAGRITAGAAACAVICGGAIHFAGESDKLKKGGSSINDDYEPSTRGSESGSGNNGGGSAPLAQTKAPYMSGAENYEEIYASFKKAYDKRKKQVRYYEETDAPVEEAVADEENGGGDDYSNSEQPKGGVTGTDENGAEYYEAKNQEEGVLEADMAKTDGKHIYYVYNRYDEDYNCRPMLNYASVADGELGSSGSIDLTPDFGKILGTNYVLGSVTVNEMYVYNGKIVVIGNVCGSVCKLDYDKLCDEYASDPWEYVQKNATFVSVYSTEDTPRLIDFYYQEGRFVDVRIAPDGYMYLVTSYSVNYFNNVKENDYGMYVPSAGMRNSCRLIDAEDILAPGDVPEDTINYAYTVVGSLDLNSEDAVSCVETKALAGYSGRLYASAKNLYAVVGWDETSVTRIEIGGGKIEPAASGKVSGRVKDQFSMSEKGDYFRIATTYENYDYYDDVEYAAVEWTRDTGSNVYVLDMDLNVVGKSETFGAGEDIKSVNFDGDIAYVVTFRQTDPLYAIDLSAPESPAILDEFKLPGFSSYMEKWSDGYLFGFGNAANEEYGGVEGLKLNMFDNSDPSDLKLADALEILDTGDYKYSSFAEYDRKALMIAPDKNLIGVQMFVITAGNVQEGYGASYASGFRFYSFEEGKFKEKGEFIEDTDSTHDSAVYSRALYVGDNVYVLSGDKFVSLDMNDLSVVAEAEF